MVRLGQIRSRKGRANCGRSQFVGFVLTRIRAARRWAWVVKFGDGRVKGCQELSNRDELVQYAKKGSEQVVGEKISFWKNWSGESMVWDGWARSGIGRGLWGIVEFCLGMVGLVVPVHGRSASL